MTTPTTTPDDDLVREPCPSLPPPFMFDAVTRFKLGPQSLEIGPDLDREAGTVILRVGEWSVRDLEVAGLIAYNRFYSSHEWYDEKLRPGFYVVQLKPHSDRFTERDAPPALNILLAHAFKETGAAAILKEKGLRCREHTSDCSPISVILVDQDRVEIVETVPKHRSDLWRTFVLAD